MVGTRRVPFRPLLSLVAALAAVSPYGGAQGCASSPQGDGPGGTAARSEDAVGAADTAGTGQTGSTGTAETGAPAPAVERVYAGFLPGTFATEPVALLPPVRIELPPEFEGGPAGQDLVPELERILLDRLPEELRILHSRAPVHAFGRWPGRDVVPAGPLEEILGWSGLPGPAGELPEAVGNAVETVGDDRGIRWFLFPRTLTVRARGPFHHAAYVEAYLLDARGERVVWAGMGFAEGRLPERDPERLLRAVVLDAARRAAADLARRVPGSNAAGGDAGFSDVDAGATREVR